MSIKQCCCLCFTPCSEYKSMQNELGESNDIYEITVKYFDPIMLLAEVKQMQFSYEIKVICEDCWCHIKDFHEFQQTVVKTRSQLEETNFKLFETLEVKQEEELEIFSKEDDKSVVNESDEEMPRDIFINDDDNDLKGDDSLSILEDEDEKPLMELMKTKLDSKKNTNLKDQVVNKTKGQDISESKETPKSRKISKSNSTKDDKKTENVKGKRSKKNKTSISPGEPQKIARITYCREKCKESDAFIATWRTKLECDICQESYPDFEKLRNHFREIHKTKCYIKCCERKFYHRYVLVEHIQMHINPEMHKCHICDKIFSSNYNLKLHKKLVHDLTKELECEVCHKFFKQKVTLERHLLTHATGNKDFICPECGKGYVAELLLKLHIKHVHNVDRVCDQCGKTVHGFSALKKHLMEHAGIERPKFPCDVCGAQLKSHENLKRHKAAYHNDGCTIYVCSICGKVSASEKALISHKKIVHEGERKHKCTYCDKAFKRSKVLREHIATHTGQALYQCAHCPQTFKVSANMHHHRKKVHPIEWAEGRKNRLQIPKVNINQVTNQVVI